MKAHVFPDQRLINVEHRSLKSIFTLMQQTVNFATCNVSIQMDEVKEISRSVFTLSHGNAE